MNEPIIHCPSCKCEIKLTQSLAAPLIEATRERYERQLAVNEERVSERERAAEGKIAEAEKMRASVDEQVATQLAQQWIVVAAEESAKARQRVAADLDANAAKLCELHALVRERDSKLADAQREQAELVRKQRELDDAKRAMDLTIERRISASLSEIRAKAKSEAEGTLQLTITEKEEQIASMKRQIEDLKRKADQGSQQLQGEALELQLEAMLRSRFPLDAIEPVAKGEFGGDIVQKVFASNGVFCGAILWESKRTRNWSDGWLPKLREDQRQAKAELAVLISDALPKSVEAFDQVDGIWVTERRCAIPVAIALRQTLIELHKSRQIQCGQRTKMELLYDYLTGPRFRHRIEAIVEKFSDMQADLAREKKATIRLWAKRDAQIQGVIEATVGMYGDMQGIAGRAMLDMPTLEALPNESHDPSLAA